MKMLIDRKKLKIRNYFKDLFYEKKRFVLKKKIKVERIRQVRKFTSKYMFDLRKKRFADFFLNQKKTPEAEKSESNLNLIYKKELFKEQINNKINRIIAGRIYKSLEKLKKRTRMKKNSKKFRKLSFFFKNRDELFRENPLMRFYNSNIEVISLNYDLLLSFHSAIGNSSKYWINPSVFSKILAIRNDMILYDLNTAFISLRKGLQSVFQVSKFKGTIIGYINYENNYKFSGVGFDHFLRTWLPGYLTNFKQVMKNILSLQTKNVFNLTRRQSKFLTNIDLKRHLPSNYYYYLMNKKNRGKRKITKIPAVPSFGFSLEDYDIWVNECQKIGLRTMAICDSESFPRKIDYPVIANQKSLSLSFFFVKLISESIGSAKRFDYFSFIGFNLFQNAIKTTFNKKVDDSLLKKISFTVTGNRK